MPPLATFDLIPTVDLTPMEPRLGPLTRRQALGGAVGGAILLGLSGCGDDPDDVAADSGLAAAAPSRVVALGQGADADTLIALGITPVAMSAGFTADVYPWTAEALGSRRGAPQSSRPGSSAGSTSGS